MAAEPGSSPSCVILSVALRVASSGTLVPGTGVSRGSASWLRGETLPTSRPGSERLPFSWRASGQNEREESSAWRRLLLPRLREPPGPAGPLCAQGSFRTRQPSLMLQTRSSPLWSGSIRGSLVRHLILICYMNSTFFKLDITSEFLNQSVLSLCPCSDGGGLWQDSDRWPLAHFLLVLSSSLPSGNPLLLL